MNRPVYIVNISLISLFPISFRECFKGGTAMLTNTEPEEELGFLKLKENEIPKYFNLRENREAFMNT